MTHPLLNTRESILEKNLMNVMFVGRLLVTVDPLPNIREFTLEKDPMNVKNAKKPLGNMHILLIIREFTLGSHSHHQIQPTTKSYKSYLPNISEIYILIYSSHFSVVTLKLRFTSLRSL